MRQQQQQVHHIYLTSALQQQCYSKGRQELTASLRTTGRRTGSGDIYGAALAAWRGTGRATLPHVDSLLCLLALTSRTAMWLVAKGRARARTRSMRQLPEADPLMLKLAAR